FVQAGDATVYGRNSCSASFASGTSWASPTVAGAAALVRQYYTDGFYQGKPIMPSAALLKATIIAAARPAPYRWTRSSRFDAEPVPSYEQGFGFPVLDDALHFPGETRNLRVYDVSRDLGLAQGETFTTTLDVRAGTPSKAVLVWTDPAGHAVGVADTSMQLVNDLDLRVVSPSGTAVGNERLTGGQPDRINNVEGVTIDAPSSGKVTVTVSAPRIAAGPRQGYALVLTGDFDNEVTRRRAVRR
ncbi:MAG: S8 family serine peptidase, partial [Thermoanaerobaculia bacterium]